MKNKKKIWIIVCLMAWMNAIWAEDKAYVSDFSISAEETKEVSVTMDNSIPYVAFEFDLYLPTGITLEGYEVDKSRVPESTTVSMAKQENGSYRFLAVAMSMGEIAGNSGGIVTLKLKAAKMVSIGSLAGCLRQVKLSKADATGVTIAEIPFVVKVLAPSTVTARNMTREYGEPNPVLGYDVAGGELEGVPDISCEATATSPVGTYPIAVSKGDVKNYKVTCVNGTLTVTKAPLTITAQDYVVKQGEPLPIFDVSYEGFKNGETADVLTEKPTVSCAATSSSVLGTYEIVVSGAEAQNYDISYVKGTLSVIDADAVVVTAKNYTRQYGEANPTFEYTSAGATLEGTPTITCEATETSPVGTYPIVVSKGGVTNYNDSYVNGTLTVTKAPLTITAQDYVVKQGEPLPAFDVSYEGFKNGETADVLTEKPAIACAATSSSVSGTYEIVVSGAEAENYEMTYVAGTLTIEKTMAIPLLEENTEVSFEESITKETDLTDTVVDNVYVTLDTEADDGYDTAEKCIVLASVVTEEQMETIVDKDVKDETVKENYNGLIFAVPIGKGVIRITAQTKGNRMLSVKVGDAEAQTFVQPERGEIEVPYTATESTYVYIYGADTSAGAQRRVSGSETENGVLIYGIKWEGVSTDVDAITTANEGTYQIYTIDGTPVKVLQKGVNIIRYSDGTSKKVYVK